jgi:hypothetical protein
MCTDNGVRHQIALPEARLQGREAIAGAAQGLIDVVPDEVVEIRRVTEGSDGTVVVEWVFKEAHEKRRARVAVEGRGGQPRRRERVRHGAATVNASTAARRGRPSGASASSPERRCRMPRATRSAAPATRTTSNAVGRAPGRGTGGEGRGVRHGGH